MRDGTLEEALRFNRLINGEAEKCFRSPGLLIVFEIAIESNPVRLIFPIRESELVLPAKDTPVSLAGVIKATNAMRWRDGGERFGNDGIKGSIRLLRHNDMMEMSLDLFADDSAAQFHAASDFDAELRFSFLGAVQSSIFPCEIAIACPLDKISVEGVESQEGLFALLDQLADSGGRFKGRVCVREDLP